MIKHLSIKNFDYVIKTDASVKDGRSTHYFGIHKVALMDTNRGKQWGKKKPKFSSNFKSFYDSALKAEIYSIEAALKKCEEENIKNILVRTDSKIITACINGEDVSLAGIEKHVKGALRSPSITRDLDNIKRILRKLKGRIEYNPRYLNGAADRKCSEMWENSRMTTKVGRNKVKNFRMA